MHQAPPPAAAPVRLAASMMLVRQRDDMEILLIKRAAALSYGEAIAFPGGALSDEDRDPAWRGLSHAGDLTDDDLALRITGWREAWEETGIVPPGARPAASLRSAFADAAGRIDLTRTLPFAQWTTPPGLARRWDTYFFLCAIDTDDPLTVDPSECAWAAWFSIRDLLTGARGAEFRLPFPTWLNLQLLAESRTVADAVAMARARPVPRVTPERIDGDDIVTLRVPPDAGFPVWEMVMPRADAPTIVRAPS